jgi:DNA-binding MarR family transcriptional regulator
VPGKSRTEQLNAQIEECVVELGVRTVARAEKLAQQLGIPLVFIKALHTLDAPMAMKELGKKLHCDPSFVTAVADMLEKRGLARREPHPADRRVKNLVLTDDGLSLKSRLETEIAARMPWNRVLSDDERTQLLALIRKMLSADSQDPGAHPDLTSALVGLDEALVNSLRDPAPQATPDSPPAAAGEVSSDVSNAGVAR